MANRWTRVPDRPVPALAPLSSRALPAADAFMWLMASRPGGLSLRSAWVTPATFLLSAAAAIAGAALVVLAVTGLARYGLAVEVVALVGGLVLLAGSSAVLLVGVGQRRADRRRGSGDGDSAHR
jgi:hypothetical protein